MVQGWGNAQPLTRRLADVPRLSARAFVSRPPIFSWAADIQQGCLSTMGCVIWHLFSKFSSEETGRCYIGNRGRFFP